MSIDVCVWYWLQSVGCIPCGVLQHLHLPDGLLSSESSPHWPWHCASPKNQFGLLRHAFWPEEEGEGWYPFLDRLIISIIWPRSMHLWNTLLTKIVLLLSIDRRMDGQCAWNVRRIVLPGLTTVASASDAFGEWIITVHGEATWSQCSITTHVQSKHSQFHIYPFIPSFILPSFQDQQLCWWIQPKILHSISVLCRSVVLVIQMFELLWSDQRYLCMSLSAFFCRSDQPV